MSRAQARSIEVESRPAIPGGTAPQVTRGDARLCSGRLSALTIDVEDYFQVSGFENVVLRESWPFFESRVERNTDRLLALLAEARVTATFFVLGWIAERYPMLVRRIQSAGHELACHSYAHRIVYQCTPEEFRADTRRAKRLLEDISGAAVIGYRAPSFSITRRSLWALEILAAEGFEYDSSVFPVFRDRYGIPGTPRHPYQVELGNSRSCRPSAALGRAHPGQNHLGCHNGESILEAPPSTVRVMGATLPMGGGGYLRLFPTWVFHRAIRWITETERWPAILYLHPWELDPDQPRIRSGSRVSRFRHYVNLDKTEEKLAGLIARLTFAPLQDVLGQLRDLPSTPLQALANRLSP